MPSCDEDLVVGRDAYLDSLRAALGRVRSGHPQTVLVEGAAGLGKSTLVERFLREQDDVRLLRAGGEQWEALVAYGVVDQLMRAAGAGPSRVFASRLRAVPPEEPISVGASLLEILEDLEQDSVVVLVIEDAHWTDTDSLRAVLFALRRLVSERVMTLLTVRDEESARLPDGLRRLATGTAGVTLRLKPLTAAEVRELASARGLADFSPRTAERLHNHTAGNPLYVQALLDEVPADRWRSWEPVLPAPRAFAEQITRRVEVCGPAARRLVEAASALGATAPLSIVAELAGVADPLAALDETVGVGLLHVHDEPGVRDVGFPHPLIQAAVHEHMGPGRRVELHLAAAELLEDEGARLRHRVAAADPPDEGLAAELSSYAQCQAEAGAWASAASALVQAARLTAARQPRQQLLLRALDAMIGSGDLMQASVFAEEIAGLEPGPLRDAGLGYLAILSGRPREAEALLHSAEERCPASDAALAGVIAQRWALHSVGRLSGSQLLERSRQSLSLTPPNEPVRNEAEALLGLGYAWSGHAAEGVAAYEAVLDRADALPGWQGRVQMPLGWLRLVADDVDEARSLLAETAPEQLRRGSVRIAVWAYVWLSRSEFLLGFWERAAASAERAVSMLEETGHEWLRPLARWAAGAVPAARGEWRAAEEHALLGAARPGDYELMVVASCLARAQIEGARNDPEAVLQALEPVRAIGPRDGLDEPGFWPWAPSYGDALVNLGKWEQAGEFLAPYEDLAAARERRTCIAALAAARGRVEAAAGRPEAAEAAFRRGLDQLEGLPLPFVRAQLELPFGQMLRRQGHRRAAAEKLQAAYDRFADLQARPYLERCARELNACGLRPTKRHDTDPSQLTAQELAVARLVGAGRSNREVAGALFISMKTVQFHLTHIYTKLRLSSRAELTAHLRNNGIFDPSEEVTDGSPSAGPGDLAG